MTDGSRHTELRDAPLQEVECRAGTIPYRRVGIGTPLVFVHGLAVNGNLWRKVVPLLADRYDCVVLELPLGAHERPMPPSTDLRPPALADLIGDAIAALGLAPARIVANDTGGALVQILASRHPELVENIVLTPCDSYNYFLPPMFRSLPFIARLPGGVWLLSQGLRVDLIRRLPLAYGWLSAHPIDRDARDDYTKSLHKDRGLRRDLGKVFRGIHRRYTLEAAQRLRSFEKPVLVAWADHDRVFPRKLADRLVGDLPRARLVIIEGAGALVPEDAPAALAQQIDDFESAPATQRGMTTEETT